MIPLIQKEFMEIWRTGKMLILALVFTVVGIMNPAIAKMTPWLMELMKDSLEGTGLIMTQVTVNALNSWTQFFKNMPIALVIFVLSMSGVLTKEYRCGTLILSLSRGVRRYKILLSKALVLILLWTGGYWLCFGITYGYNAWYWENAVALNLFFAAFAWWELGMLVAALILLFSALTNSGSGVTLGVAGSVFGMYLVSLLPKVGAWMPTKLMDGNAIVYALADPRAYGKAAILAGMMFFVCLGAAISVLHKKKL